MGDPLVKVGDKVMTLSQYQALVNQAVSTYTQQITVAIDQLSSLQDQMYVHSGDVSSTLSTLAADMAGLDHAIGTDDQGNKFRNAWFGSSGAWAQLQQAFSGLSQALVNIGDGLGNAADTVFQAEEKTLTGFNNMNVGFHFNAVDPRQRPTGGGRMRAF
jgi:uncharacterized protein YukE